MASKSKFNLPTEHTLYLKIWGTIYPGDNDVYLCVTTSEGTDMTTHGSFLVAERVITTPLSWEGVDPTKCAVDAIKAQIQAIRAESQSRVNALTEQMNSLLSIDYVPEIR